MKNRNTHFQNLTIENPRTAKKNLHASFDLLDNSETSAAPVRKSQNSFVTVDPKSPFPRSKQI